MKLNIIHIGASFLLICATLFGVNTFAQEVKNLTLDSDTLNKKDKDAFSDFKIDKGSKSADTVAKGINIVDILNPVNKTKASYSWRLNSKTFDLEEQMAFDTVVFLSHLVEPNQKSFITQTYLGNLGAPIQTDHFFERNFDYPFLFSRGYSVYLHQTISGEQYNVKSPHTVLEYSTGGKKKEADQILKVLHTQNVNRYLNLGIHYDYYNTKGMYENQLTRNNVVSVFGSYYKDRISAQATFTYTYIRNKENGGLEDDKFIQDTVLEASLVPFRLNNASSEYRQRSFAAIAGYDILVKRTTLKSVDGSDSIVVSPLVTSKLIFDANRYTRVYSDDDTVYYKNYYINKYQTHDSIYLLNYTTTALLELTQIAKYPGIPGLRVWLTNTFGNYYHFKPTDFIFERENSKIKTNHFGVGVFSKSAYLNYSGSLRFYINGYRANDKELFGQLMVLPWKSTEMPYVKGTVLISDREPDIFLKNYYSNNFMWSNSFEKEKRFMIGGMIGAEKWRLEAGYNLIRIVDYLYFDSEGLPTQANNVTATSAYVKKTFKLGGFYFVNKVLWQANTNEDVLSLPTFSVFSSLFYEHELVKNVLTGQFGVSGFYRTKFYADAFMPATAQFINQREKKIGDYPFADVFANFRWKRATLFFKYEHVNQGLIDSEYFTALHYAANRRVFKFGLSWIFYN